MLLNSDNKGAARQCAFLARLVVSGREHLLQGWGLVLGRRLSVDGAVLEGQSPVEEGVIGFKLVELGWSLVVLARVDSLSDLLKYLLPLIDRGARGY